MSQSEDVLHESVNAMKNEGRRTHLTPACSQRIAALPTITITGNDPSQNPSRFGFGWSVGPMFATLGEYDPAGFTASFSQSKANDARSASLLKTKPRRPQAGRGAVQLLHGQMLPLFRFAARKADRAKGL